jgi:tRNA A37 threonylcarbamoyladenosine biosynthesis protein TsaE
MIFLLFSSLYFSSSHIHHDVLSSAQVMAGSGDHGSNVVPTNQSILVSGESGAGKTVTTKIVLNYFAMLSKKVSCSWSYLCVQFVSGL